MVPEKRIRYWVVWGWRPCCKFLGVPLIAPWRRGREVSGSKEIYRIQKSLCVLKFPFCKILRQICADENPISQCLIWIMYSQKWNLAASLFPKQNYNVLSPNFHIHVSVNDLYIPMIGLVEIYKSLTGTWTYRLGTTRPRSFISGNMFRIFGAVQCYIFFAWKRPAWPAASPPAVGTTGCPPPPPAGTRAPHTAQRTLKGQ